MFKIPILDHLR